MKNGSSRLVKLYLVGVIVEAVNICRFTTADSVNGNEKGRKRRKFCDILIKKKLLC
jgi:hypothetical protein